LIEAGAAGGLEEAALRRDLAGDRDRALIEQQAHAAASAGIGGVPFFVFGKRCAVAGAQEPEVFAAAIEQALAADAA
jgi:predicted DsbA family dithiol-disulfide isomerase